MAETALAVQNSGAIAGFESRQISDTEAGTHSVVAREESETKAAIALARHFPRDEQRAYTAIIKSCQRPSFAECCVYSFPRGGQTISGPSVDLAREAARVWGNIRWGLRIVTEDDERVHIKGYAYDAETNTYAEAEDKFQKLVQRKVRGGGTDWIVPDERDLRELVNRRGAICVRNALLQLIPPDIIDEAIATARQTMQRAAGGEIQQDRAQAIRRLSLAFSNLGVTTDMIAKRLGHALDIMTNEEIVDLRAVYKSIQDGNSRREEYFEVGESKKTIEPPKSKSATEKKPAKGADEPPAEQGEPGDMTPLEQMSILLDEACGCGLPAALAHLESWSQKLYRKPFASMSAKGLEAVEAKIKSGEITVKAAEPAAT